VAGRRGRGFVPPILTLLDLIEEHRGALEYDWRNRFHLGLSAVPSPVMGWGEAWRLVQVLVQDPTSRIAAAVAGWEAPRSPEWMVLADMYDLRHQLAAQKKSITPYPRPWDKKRSTWGKATRSQRDIRAALAARGHVAAHH